MTPCDGTPNSKTWCCGSTKDCCTSEHAITLAQRLGTRASAHTGSQLSNGAKAGIAVGVFVGVIVLMTFLFFVRRAERNKIGSYRHQHYDYRATGTTQETMGIPVDNLPSRSATAKYEVPA